MPNKRSKAPAVSARRPSRTTGTGPSPSLADGLAGIRAVNTHCHHIILPPGVPFTLKECLWRSYVGWMQVPLDDTAGSRAAFLRQVRHTSYFHWLQEGLRAIYGFRAPLSAETWDDVSASIQARHADPGFSFRLFETRSRYARILLDSFWETAQCRGYPASFVPVFRINMFLFGYRPDTRDHNQKNPYEVCGCAPIRDIDAYLAFVRARVVEAQARGAVCLKSALAYDRGLDFAPADKAAAQRAFAPSATANDIRAFQDYVFDALCRFAAERSLPFQCHTGLGQLTRTNALRLQAMIAAHPATRFVLFHGSYPWTDDLMGLVHNYQNVYPDLCWLPLISTSAAVRALDELLDVANADRIGWGCDTQTAEESYGALLAIRHVLERVLAARIDQGWTDRSGALALGHAILRDNAIRLYGLGE